MNQQLLHSLKPPLPPEEAAFNFFEKLEQNFPHAKWESLYATQYQTTTAHALLQGIEANSPFLSAIISKHPEWLADILEHGLEDSYSTWMKELSALPLTLDESHFMRQLRLHKMKSALLIAWADLSKEWPLETITQALSSLAECATNLCVNYLLESMRSKGTLQFDSIENSGIIVLGMGKLGGKELNYSSDIDLILLYDPLKIEYTGSKSLQHVLNKFAQDLSRFLQDRTADGYVFRVDLRLRPDPASTPLIVNRDAAIRYYESVGQNWERAAYMKARPIAGDLNAAHTFLQELNPFIWRKNLDFASLSDIQAVRHQMSGGDNLDENIEGHNIKTGLGGIREIEFIAHTFQLIWGGKEPRLRTIPTCETLRQAHTLGMLKKEEFIELIGHYRFLREVEHRLQMMDDQQTHTIPTNQETLNKLSHFSGFTDSKSFTTELLTHLRAVYRIYMDTIDTEEQPPNSSGPLIFTGVDSDPSTIKTLKKMGFRQPDIVIQEIQNWHRGNIRAMRQLRARQLLTKLTPALLNALSKTISPDQSFHHFSKFLSGMPSGIQLFSLFSTNLKLLDTIATIMGYAPQLAKQFSRHPEWLEILLTDDLSEINFANPDPETYLRLSNHPEDNIRWLCRFRNEWEFLIGTRLLQKKISPEDVKNSLTRTADNTLSSLIELVWNRFKEKYGIIENTSFAVVALGRLGSEEVTFGSDLDLIFVFDADDVSQLSNGSKEIPANLYYNRLCQRIVGGSQALTSAGRLYEIDTRLRPGGESQSLAVHFDMFHRYYRADAWTFEKMALLRKRVVFGTKELREKIETSLNNMFAQPRDTVALQRDILDVRRKMAAAYGCKNMWDVKHALGGLIDITFIAQFIALRDANKHHSLIQSKPTKILKEAQKHGLLDSTDYTLLLEGWEFQERLQTTLRLCNERFVEQESGEGIKELLATILEVPSFHHVKNSLNQYQSSIYELFKTSVGSV